MSGQERLEACAAKPRAYGRDDGCPNAPGDAHENARHDPSDRAHDLNDYVDARDWPSRAILAQLFYVKQHYQPACARGEAIRSIPRNNTGPRMPGTASARRA